MTRPQDACTYCGSTDFEEVDGLLYCHNGHAQEGGQQVDAEDDYARSGKISRQKDVKEKQKVLKIYRGRKGFALYLKAWQHILWRQCYTLVHDFGVPNELWAVVRELWNLRLTQLVQKLEDIAEIDLNPINDESSVPYSEAEDDDADTESRYFKTSRQLTDSPTLRDTIALTYVGILTLRHAIRLSTIYSYIRREKICYIRAIRDVPREIRDHLAPEYHLALDTTVVPSEHDLQLAVHRMTTMYGRTLGMETPALNWTLILMENIRDLALPIEVYPTVKRLADILSYDMAYPSKHDQRRTATTYPESQLTAMIVVATKLLYPFNSATVKRHLYTTNEPAAMQMNWQTWLDARLSTNVDKPIDVLPSDKAIEVTDRDILEMSPSQLDRYMDWFQRTYTKDVKGGQLQKQIVDMFSLHNVPSPAGDDEDEYQQQRAFQRLRSTQEALRPQAPTGASSDTDMETEASILRPGQHYEQYRTIEEMSDVAKLFHQEAAHLACLSTDALLRACIRTEGLLLRHQHERRRSQHFGGHDVLETA